MRFLLIAAAAAAAVAGNVRRPGIEGVARDELFPAPMRSRTRAAVRRLVAGWQKADSFRSTVDPARAWAAQRVFG